MLFKVSLFKLISINRVFVVCKVIKWSLEKLVGEKKCFRFFFLKGKKVKFFVWMVFFRSFEDSF